VAPGKQMPPRRAALPRRAAPSRRAAPPGWTPRLCGLRPSARLRGRYAGSCAAGSGHP